MYKVYREGGALVYPLYFDYPTDENLLQFLDETYMLGDAIKVSPVLDQGINATYSVYFPVGAWADLNQQNITINSTGESI